MTRSKIRERDSDREQQKIQEHTEEVSLFFPKCSSEVRGKVIGAFPFASRNTEHGKKNLRARAIRIEPPRVSCNRGKANEHSPWESFVRTFLFRGWTEGVSARFPDRISGRFERAKRNRSPCEPTVRSAWGAREDQLIEKELKAAVMLQRSL